MQEILSAVDAELFGVWFLIGAALVFWMQAGFAMVETGFTRAKNSGNIIMKNLMDFCIGTVMFVLIGFSFLLGEDLLGFIGKPGFDIFTAYKDFNFSSFVFNLVFCATTATIVPTPLGSDNVAIAAELANTTEFAGLTATDYVFKYHAIVSIPTLLIMAAIHFFWQKRCDKKAGVIESKAVESKDVEEIKGGLLYKTVYAILPLLPIILLIGSFAVQKITGAQIDISVEVATLFSFIVAIICEIIRKRNAGETLKETEAFFKGMGGSMPIVALLVAGTVFVTGLKSIGLITALQSAMTGLSGGGLGFVLPLILVALTALIVLLSGSGTALFFAMVPLMVPLAAAAGISALAVSIPMGLAGNLLRAVSPVSAVVMIVAGSVKREPFEVVKRTSVPMIAGTVVMFVLSMVIFL